jgi:hypothetical protein
MNTELITIRGLLPSYQPSMPIAGVVDWRLNQRIDKIIIRLFWMASGAAPVQIGVVDTYTIERADPAGTSRFEFLLPAGPWSFQGQLLGLGWGVEAIALPSKLNASTIFTVSPTGMVIDAYAGAVEE